MARRSAWCRSVTPSPHGPPGICQHGGWLLKRFPGKRKKKEEAHKLFTVTSSRMVQWWVFFCEYRGSGCCQLELEQENHKGLTCIFSRVRCKHRFDKRNLLLQKDPTTATDHTNIIILLSPKLNTHIKHPMLMQERVRGSVPEPHPVLLNETVSALTNNSSLITDVQPHVCAEQMASEYSCPSLRRSENLSRESEAKSLIHYISMRKVNWSLSAGILTASISLPEWIRLEGHSAGGLGSTLNTLAHGHYVQYKVK